MNNYPSWWDSTVTIYNRSVASDNRVTWYRKVISGAFWKNTGEKVTVGETTLDSSKTVCRLRVDSAFLPHADWDKLVDKSTKYTLRVGDIVILGTVTDAIDEYTAGSRSSDVLKKYSDLQGAMRIDRFSINTGGGRGQEHYYLRGI